ncbi:MAG: cytochrome c [Gammaproteobacteria bacterium]|nr:cytochrome c [Gammaproteobacteria bacterium]
MQKLVLMTGLLLATSLVWAAGDKVAGEKAFNSKACMGCHGPAGKQPIDKSYPVLAGQPVAYTIAQLKAFQTGKRDNPLMKPMAMQLTAPDIENIAAYLAAQK